MKRTSTSAILQHARTLYREHGPQVDAKVRTRLQAARSRALQAPNARPRATQLRWAVPGGTFAAMALAAVLIWQPLRQAPQPNHGTSTVQSAAAGNILPPDAGQVDPAMYQNLDFYAWLAQQPMYAQNHVR